MCKCAIPQFKPHARRVSQDGHHFTEIVRRFCGHIDHKVPLWKVVGIEPQERIKYFGPLNLQILCEECHTKKTSREAAERAHYKRLATKSFAPAEKGKRRIGNRLMRSRGFDNRFRRKMNGKVEAR
jgi:hypothetical protein